MIDLMNPRESPEIDKVTYKLLGIRSKYCRFEMLDQGQVSYVYRVSADGPTKGNRSSFILKLRGESLRKFLHICMRKEATKEEYEAIAYLSERGFSPVPRILYINQFQQLLAMEDFGTNGMLLHDVLASGQCTNNFLIGLVESAVQVALSLQTVNPSDLFGNEVLCQRFKDKVRLLTELSEDPSVRFALPEMIHGQRNAVLLHCDMCPKNIFVLQTQWGLIDFDSLAVGDGAFDTCYFLAHLFLYRPKIIELISVEECCDAISHAFSGSTLKDGGSALLIKAVLEFRLAESHGITFNLAVSNTSRRCALGALRSNEKNPIKAIKECLNELG